MINRFLFLLVLVFGMFSCRIGDNETLKDEVLVFEKNRVNKLAAKYMGLPVVAVTDSFCVRSAGNRHDFYSEGDYWWPDSQNVDGSYVRRDGLSNPRNFVEHRHAMIRMSRIVGAMTSQWILSGNEKYAREAMRHLKAWFVDEDTRMNPNMLYSQAIKGRFTGRGIGIIDGLHLVDVARSVQLLEKAKCIQKRDIEAIKAWFDDFLIWISTHEYGKTERAHPNNHGTVWALQASTSALLTENEEMITYCENRFKEQLLPNQMATDGSFPLELERTKPYGYSIFNLDALCLLAQVLTIADNENFWNYTTDDGRGLEKGLEFLYPFVEDKTAWPYMPDVLFWEDWPVAQPALVLGGVALSNSEYVNLWKKLDHDPAVSEIQRNLVMRYPVLWLIN